MNPNERQIRAAVYSHFIGTGAGPQLEDLVNTTDLTDEEARIALRGLAQAHLLLLVPGEDRVMMAHPFSAVPTGNTAVIGDRSWNANCAWDALAILAMLGDGEAHVAGPDDEIVWRVHDGDVSPDGVVHLHVPAREFWTDIEFT